MLIVETTDCFLFCKFDYDYEKNEIEILILSYKRNVVFRVWWGAA
jgi:hypothetical protein